MLSALINPRGSTGQLPVYALSVLAGFALLFGAVLIDVLLAFIGGVVIGIALGYWILPLLVDKLEDVPARIRRGRRPRGK